MKNYIGFINDHSGSMSPLCLAAMNDYNTMIASVKDAASREMQDTIVSTIGIGVSGGGGEDVRRQVVISNPHVLKPIAIWESYGNTPLYDGIGNMIELFSSLPDANNQDVSFLISITTDGEENGPHNYTRSTLKQKILKLQATGRWTFVFRVPKGYKQYVSDLGVPAENIQQWETTNAGMEKSTKETKQAMDSYFTARAAGAKSSTAFYASAADVDTSALADITKDTSLYVVPDADMGIEIRDLILRHRMEYLKGAAFYQLTKTESRVSHTKLIVIRSRLTGKTFAGLEARQMIGLPTDRNARLHPGDHGNYDIFIQSESVNRKLVGGTGVLYWAKIGVPFTEADLAYLKPKAAVDPTGPIVLPKVAPATKPTKSPIPKTKRVTGPTVDGKPVRFFASRREGREHIGNMGNGVKDLDKDYVAHAVTGNNDSHRWFVFL